MDSTGSRIFMKNAFDVVLLGDVLEHLVDPRAFSIK